MATAATALVMIALVALAIAHFVTHHIAATANARVVTIAITFVTALTIALFVPHQPPLPLPSPSVSIALVVAVINALSDTVAIAHATLSIALVVTTATALFDTCHLVAIAIVHVVDIDIARPPPSLP